MPPWNLIDEYGAITHTWTDKLCLTFDLMQALDLTGIDEGTART